MPKPENNVLIGFCLNPACKSLHIEFLDHPEHGEVLLVLDPTDARAFAERIIKVLDNPHAITH